MCHFIFTKNKYVIKRIFKNFSRNVWESQLETLLPPWLQRLLLFKNNSFAAKFLQLFAIIHCMQINPAVWHTMPHAFCKWIHLAAESERSWKRLICHNSYNSDWQYICYWLRVWNTHPIRSHLHCFHVKLLVTVDILILTSKKLANSNVENVRENPRPIA